MERKVGEIFKYNDEWYQCIRNITCINCGFNNKGCLADKHITGDCSGRLDGASVVFKKLEKVGEPFRTYNPSTDKDILVQEYQYFCNPAFIKNRIPVNRTFGLYGKEGLFVEVEQKSENMEENGNS